MTVTGYEAPEWDRTYPCANCGKWRFIFATGECGACYCDRRLAEFDAGLLTPASVSGECDGGFGEGPAAAPANGSAR